MTEQEEAELDAALDVATCRWRDNGIALIRMQGRPLREAYQLARHVNAVRLIGGLLPLHIPAHMIPAQTDEGEES